MSSLPLALAAEERGPDEELESHAKVEVESGMAGYYNGKKGLDSVTAEKNKICKNLHGVEKLCKRESYIWRRKVKDKKSVKKSTWCESLKKSVLSGREK